jgi:hypothetical protein
MAKYVYVVKTGGLSRIDNKYHFYDTEVFSSEKKALERCQNGMDCNKAYDITRDVQERDVYQRKSICIDYKCMDVEGKVEMNQRYWIDQLELK